MNWLVSEQFLRIKIVKDVGNGTIVRSVICYFSSDSMETKCVEQTYLSFLNSQPALVRTTTCSELLFTLFHPHPMECISHVSSSNGVSMLKHTINSPAYFVSVVVDSDVYCSVYH